jgi:hypothetical protein
VAYERGFAACHTIIACFATALEYVVKSFGCVVTLGDLDLPLLYVDLRNVGIVGMLNSTGVRFTVRGAVVKLIVFVFIALAVRCFVTLMLVGVADMIRGGRSGVLGGGGGIATQIIRERCRRYAHIKWIGAWCDLCTYAVTGSCIYGNLPFGIVWVGAVRVLKVVARRHSSAHSVARRRRCCALVLIRLAWC